VHPNSISASANQRILELDGLRGIAILLVISFHYINNQLIHSTHFVGKTLAGVTAFGWVGVDLFFVLSGFLIGSILIRNKNSNNYFSAFYLRRIVRIIPNYYLLLVVFFCIKAIPYFADNYLLAGNDVLSGWSYFTLVNNFYMAHLNNMGNGAMSVSWSICIEEQFYIVFPFIVYILKDKWLPYFLIGVIAAASLVRAQYEHWIPAYVLLPSRMDAISFGVLIAYFHQRADLEGFVQKYFLYIVGLMVFDVIVCGYLYYRYGDLGMIKHSLFAFLFACCLVFAIARKTSWYASMLRNKALMWVGTISYSLYLFHYYILGMFHHFIGNRQGVGINNGLDLAASVLALAVSFGFSWMVFRILETPMVSWGKRFKY
jgi:peptidoglycan/LPS O-acetylase OafA/YrhL